MATNTNIYYLWQGDKIRCSDCGCWTYSGSVRHSSRCDHAQDHTHFSGPQDFEESQIEAVEQAQQAPLAPLAQHDAAKVRAAKDGEAYRVGLAEDDLLDLVRRGKISVSDAMNQDF